MPQQVVAVSSQPCVWMCAGLLSYRLCDRDFDCENCPLDAALHGDLSGNGHTSGFRHRRSASDFFPDDRLYSDGHVWAQRTVDTSHGWRIGVDAFAGALIGTVTAVDWTSSKQVYECGDPVCEIDAGIGVLSVGAPISGRVLRGNERVRDDPDLLVRDPYDSGWIIELAAIHDANASQLLSAAEARDRLNLDLRRFRRFVAFRLFAAATPSDINFGDTDVVTDLRKLIAGDHYVECIREFVH